eukprot:TRINITY_DN562_c0_g2_i3.p1 TRINITY_DN562_c0_g2~~TRINITY_DN562_c0_g2_i3.p1  ORF type:complete len:77 (-),score=3.95 TRINITY_DN562_c0_g2_i3:354-584(-)
MERQSLLEFFYCYLANLHWNFKILENSTDSFMRTRYVLSHALTKVVFLDHAKIRTIMLPKFCDFAKRSLQSVGVSV